MAYVISDECISCGACAADCPCEAIVEGAEHYEIDADKCVDCGACAAGCPVEAIAQGEQFLNGFMPSAKRAAFVGSFNHFK